jgi:hypothetical protein
VGPRTPVYDIADEIKVLSVVMEQKIPAAPEIYIAE